MRYVRFGPRDQERPGAVGMDERLRDISSLTPEIDPAFLASEAFVRCDRHAVEACPVVKGDVRLGVPIKGISKIVGFGINYHCVVERKKMAVPTYPIIFFKTPNTLSGPHDPIILPTGHHQAFWEVELAIVMGRRARRVGVAEANEFIAGYTLGNDLTENTFIVHPSGQWWRAKNFDTFLPLGPWLVTKDDVRDPQNLQLTCDIDGVKYQDGNTKNMIFSIPELVSHASQFMTLEPGDLLLSGSPAGTGGTLEPPVFLHEGNMVHLWAEGLGEQKCPVVREKA